MNALQFQSTESTLAFHKMKVDLYVNIPEYINANKNTTRLNQFRDSLDRYVKDYMLSNSEEYLNSVPSEFTDQLVKRPLKYNVEFLCSIIILINTVNEPEDVKENCIKQFHTYMSNIYDTDLLDCVRFMLS